MNFSAMSSPLELLDEDTMGVVLGFLAQLDARGPSAVGSASRGLSAKCEEWATRNCGRRMNSAQCVALQKAWARLVEKTTLELKATPPQPAPRPRAVLSDSVAAEWARHSHNVGRTVSCTLEILGLDVYVPPPPTPPPTPPRRSQRIAKLPANDEPDWDDDWDDDDWEAHYEEMHQKLPFKLGGSVLELIEFEATIKRRDAVALLLTPPDPSDYSPPRYNYSLRAKGYSGGRIGRHGGHYVRPYADKGRGKWHINPSDGPSWYYVVTRQDYGNPDAEDMNWKTFYLPSPTCNWEYLPHRFQYLLKRERLVQGVDQEEPDWGFTYDYESDMESESEAALVADPLSDDVPPEPPCEAAEATDWRKWREDGWRVSYGSNDNAGCCVLM